MDVRMPDGTVITNVPDNITQTELLRRYQMMGKAAGAPAAPEPQEGGSDLARGFTNILPQLKETFGAAQVLAGKTLDNKEMMESGRERMRAAEKDIDSRESDSFTKAWEKGIGTVLTDWLPYQIGAGAGSLAETLLSMGVGAAAGAGIASIPGAATGAVAKELVKKGVREKAEEILKEGGEKAAQEYIEREAKKALRGYGAATGMGAQSAVHGAGEVTSRAVEELEKEGKTMEDIDLGRVMPAAIVHGVADFIANKIMIGGFKGLDQTSTNSLIKDITLAIGKTGVKEIPAEEIQTMAERYGAALSLSDVEALKEYIDTAAASMAMSVVPGGIGGARTYYSRDIPTETNEQKNNEIQDVGGFPADTPADMLQKDPDTKTDADLEAMLSPTIDTATGNPTAATSTSAENPVTGGTQGSPANTTTPDTQTAATQQPQDEELTKMQAEYDERQKKIDAGTHPNMIAARKKNETLKKKIEERKNELLNQQLLASDQASFEQNEEEKINVTQETKDPSVTGTPDNTTPTGPITAGKKEEQQTETAEAELSAAEQADLQNELDEELGQSSASVGRQERRERKKTTKTLKQLPKKTIKEEREDYPSVDEIKNVGFLAQRSYHSAQAPADINEAIKSAAAEMAYDIIDSADLKGGVQPELDAKWADPSTRVKGGKKSDPQSYMTDDEIVALYKKHGGKKKLGDIRQAYLDVRNDFIKSLDPNQRAIFDLLVNRNLLQEILAEKRRGQERTRATGYKRRKAVKDVEEQVAEAEVTPEQKLAEEEKVAQAALAETKAKTMAENNRRTKVSMETERAINDTDDVTDVVRAISKENQRAGIPINEFNTREIASAILAILRQMGMTMRAKIVFGDVEGNNDGKFDPSNDVITIRGQNGQYTGTRRLDQVVMHEVTHYLLDHAIDNRQAYLKSLPADKRAGAAAALNRLDNNYRFVKGKLGDKYNIGTMKEFLAEMFSNSRLQADVANLPAPSERARSMFSIIVDNILRAIGYGASRQGDEGKLLEQVFNDMSAIVSIPTPELRGTEVSYSANPPPPTPPTQTTTAAPTPKGPSRDNDLNDNSGYEIAEYQHPRTVKGLYNTFRKAESWRAVATKFQNDRYPIKTWEDRLDMAGKIIYDVSKKFNNVFTQITLSTSRAKNFYNRYVKPLHEELDNAVMKLAKASGMDTDQTLGFMHRLLEALHEPERRRAKYVMTVPLSTDANQGLVQNGKPISAADRRAQILNLLDTKALTEGQAKQLLAELDRIVDSKKPDGSPRFLDPFGNSSANFPKPKTAEQAKAVLDQNNVLYNVIGLGSDKMSAQEVVAKRMDQYMNHPNKAEIDRILDTMKKFNGPKGVTTQLSKYSNYWSDFVSNRVAFYDFQNYAPFKGKSKFDQHSDIDELLDFDNIKMGRELQETTYAFDGRLTVSDNPLLQTISDGIRSTMRAGRKELTQSIKNAIEQGLLGKNSKIKETIPFKDRANPEIINKYKGDSYIFHYNPDGSIDILFVEDPKLRNAIRRTYKDTNGFFDKLNEATSFLGKMHTRWNYNFAPLNFVRDAITNAWAIGAEMGPKEAARFIGQIASKVVLNNALPKAMKVSALYGAGGEANFKKLEELAKKDRTYADMIEFIKEGGMVSYLQGLSMRSNFEELQKEIGRSGVVRNVAQLNRFLDIWVEMFEIASRSASYGIAKRNALQKGASEAEARTRAAAYAKNLANFEQVGEWGRTMGAFFMFFRPAATGAVRAIEAAAPAMRSLKQVELELPPEIRNDPQALAEFKKNYAERQRNARVMLSALTGLGMVTYVMAAMMSDDDDLGRNSVLTDNTEQWTRFARFHIPKEVTQALGLDDIVIQIPWGFGLGAFAAAGAQMMAVMSGKEELPKALSNIFLQISLDSFIPIPVSRINPIDNTLAFAVDSITPSVARPLVEFLINKNGLGQDIYNDANRRMGDAYLGGDKIPELWNTISRQLFNETTGAIDISPNTLYFLSNSYVDGLGRMFELGYGFTNLAEGSKQFNPKTDIPLFGSFFGSKSNIDTREWARIEKQLREKERRLNTIEKLGDPELLDRHLEKFPFDDILVEMYNKEKGGDLKELQAEANEIRLDPLLTPKDRAEMLKINKMEQNLLKNQLIDDFKAYDIKP